MCAPSNTRGFILVNMMGPVLAFGLFVAGVVWLIGGNWESFPAWAQTALKVVGVLAVLALIAGNVIASRGPNGGRRGF
jgi:hypothetical protein